MGGYFLVNGLTQKQINFCNEYVKTGSPLDAYISAYNTENRNVASVEANRLLNKGEIQKYIDDLMKPITYDAQINKIHQINFIKERINICINNNDENSIIKYTDMLNKIYGYYKDNGSNDKEPNKLLDKIDMDKVRVLINGTN